MIKYIKYFFLCLGILCSCQEKIEPSKVVTELPPIFPDYVDVTIPSTIAPLNFKVQGDYSKIAATIENAHSGVMQVQGKEYVKIPDRGWKKLLDDSKGESIKITVSVKQEGKWIEYAPFDIHISNYPIDHGLAYRLIAPGYEVYSKMGIYQRELSSFKQTPIIENTLIQGSCMNCHSFCLNNPDQMSMHLRGEFGGTILKNQEKTELYNTKTDQTLSSGVYPFWHPSGKYIAYSVNDTKQTFHEIRDERVEVLDLESDIVVYNIETNELFSCPALRSKEAFETYPAFSPDGKTLYFCTAESRPLPEEFDKIKYSLCSIPFDPENGTFGNHVDTLVSAGELNKSVSTPRPSPDGRYLMYTLADYGNFMIWHREADLWLLDLQTNDTRPLVEVNSKDADSYHSWSNNSRWFVFGSRRMDGLYTHPYIASIDEEGRVAKPFILPQADPSFYESFLYSFNVPEFITAPVKLNIPEVERKALSKERVQMKYKSN